MSIQTLGEKARDTEVRFRRNPVDRRSGEDRRRAQSFEYFANGGIERRGGEERRQLGERRTGWLRVSEWHSICLASIH